MRLHPKVVAYGVRAIWRKAIRLIQGKDLLVSDAERQQRLALCQKCPRRIGSQCGICFCFLETKTRFIDETCPATPPKW
jgi:hypothetical protein